MSEVQGLIETDRLATLSINGSDSLYWDGVACVFTSIITWIPLAIIAIYVLLRNVKSKRIVLVLFLVALTVLLCDQLSSSVAKPMFHRLRPTRDPFMLDLVDTVGGYRGGYFGFFSGHAANSFGATGWVKNNYDGSVSMEIQGTEQQIDKVIIAIQRGTYVNIENMNCKTIPVVDGETTFKVN